MTRAAGRIFLASVALALCGSSAAAVCERIVAVADVHGGYESLVSILREAGVVDRDTRWAGGDDCFVQLGDNVDRGARSRDVLELLMALEEQAPGRVHVLLGNHEVMNVIGDLRYVHPGEYESFASEETEAERREGFAAFRETQGARGLGKAELRAAFAEQHPPGWFAHRRAFSAEGRYGSWILSRRVLLRLDRTLFVHGGIEPEDAGSDLEALDDRMVSEIREYVALRRELVSEGWLHPLAPFGAVFGEVDSRLARSEPGKADDRAIRETASRFSELRGARFADPRGPLWTRVLALEDEVAFAPTLNGILEAVDVDRIVIGHTVQDGHRITARFDGRVFPIDTGCGPHYGGHPSALEIRGEEVRAIYVGETETLVAPLEAATR